MLSAVSSDCDDVGENVRWLGGACWSVHYPYGYRDMRIIIAL